MIQLTKKYPHSPRNVGECSKDAKKNTILLRSLTKYKTSVAFMARLNNAEMLKLCNFIENEFQIHIEDY